MKMGLHYPESCASLSTIVVGPIATSPHVSRSEVSLHDSSNGSLFDHGLHIDIYFVRPCLGHVLHRMCECVRA